MAEVALNSSFSIKRFEAIKQALLDVYGPEKHDEIIQRICTIMKFSPEAIALRSQKIKEARHKKAETQGMSVYEASGNKAYYHRHKNYQQNEKGVLPPK